MARRRVLTEKDIKIIASSKAEACDVVFVNKSTKELIIVRNWSTSILPPSEWEPIGIVVIPGEHGVLKDGSGTKNQCGVMSIVPMNYSTPEIGGTNEQGMYWGGYNTDITGKSDGLGRYDSITDGLLNYQNVAAGNYGSNNATELSSSWLAYLPYQNAVGWIPKQNSSPYAPSPYVGDDMKSGGYNEAYGTTEFDTEEPNLNALADFKGIINTKIITNLATGQSDWKTSDAIINSGETGYYPAACCCARFKTTGTKAFVDCTNEELREGTGFWYLPACGELGYISPRLADINDMISKLNSAYGVGVRLNITFGYFTSSEYNNKGARTAGSSAVTYTEKRSTTYAVRAFLRL